MLREIISQAFGSVHTSSPGSRLSESNGGSKRSEGRFATLKWKGSSSGKQVNDLMHSLEDWQETGTFTAALEKIESWIFSRIVESVWWQVKMEESLVLLKLDAVSDYFIMSRQSYYACIFSVCL